MSSARHRCREPARGRLHAAAALRQRTRGDAGSRSRGRGHSAAGLRVAQTGSRRANRDRAPRGNRRVSFTGPLAYAVIYVAAIIEGEIVFIGAAVLVAAGRLNPVGVMIAGALGAATGDQVFFYALRGRIAGWLTRCGAVAARHSA